MLSRRILKSHCHPTHGSSANHFQGKFRSLSDEIFSLKQNGQDFTIPWHAAEDATVHEVELGVIMNGLRRDQVEKWEDRVGAYVLLLDMGDMAMIKNALTNGLSWTIAKHQDNFLVLGDLIRKETIHDPHNIDLLLKINGETSQSDNTGNMIFGIDKQIDYLENEANIPLIEGDLLLTGTPENIAPVREGDCLEAVMMQNGQEISKIVENKIQRAVKPSFIDHAKL